MNDLVYEIYKSTKRLIASINKCNEDHSDEELCQEWLDAIKSLDESNPNFAARYQREQDVLASFTPDQINHICYQIGDWYLMMKPLLEGQHNLGYMKEKLKNMICGE